MIEWVSEWASEWVSEWVNEQVGEWVCKWMNEWASEWVNEWMNKWVSEWVSMWMNEWMDGWVSEWTSEWVREWVCEWASEYVSEWVSKQESEWVNGWRSEWVSEKASEWVNDWVSEWVSEWVLQVLWLLQPGIVLMTLYILHYASPGLCHWSFPCGIIRIILWAMWPQPLVISLWYHTYYTLGHVTSATGHFLMVSYVLYSGSCDLCHWPFFSWYYTLRHLQLIILLVVLYVSDMCLTPHCYVRITTLMRCNFSSQTKHSQCKFTFPKSNIPVDVTRMMYLIPEQKSSHLWHISKGPRSNSISSYMIIVVNTSWIYNSQFSISTNIYEYLKQITQNTTTLEESMCVTWRKELRMLRRITF